MTQNDVDDDDSSPRHRRKSTRFILSSSSREAITSRGDAVKKFGYKNWCASLGIILLLLLLFVCMSDDFFRYRSSVRTAYDETIIKKHNNKAMDDDKSQLLQPSLSLPTSSSSSFASVDFFDCQRNDSLCTFFQPRNFFQNGSGKHAFLHDFERLGGANPNLPACTGLSWWWSMSSSTLSSSSSLSTPSLVSTTTNSNNASYNYWHNLSFIHIHKCGGTTIQATMRALQKQIMTIQSSSSSSSITCTVETYKYSIGGGSKRQKEANSQKRWAHIQAIAYAQQRRQQQQEQQHHGTLAGLTSSSSSSSSFFPVFTLVRDPVDRFLSAFQQVMHYNDDLRSACLKRTAKKTIQCVIQFVFHQTNNLNHGHDRGSGGGGGPGLDVHLVPMAMHLRLFHETDIAISVFHLKDINAISQYLQLSGSLSSSFPFSSSMTMSPNNTRTAAAATATTPVINDVKHHMHDRSQVKFATSKVLATMSVKDCDSKMLQDICDLYAVDVAMMHSLGFETPYCSSSSSSS